MNRTGIRVTPDMGSQKIRIGMIEEGEGTNSLSILLAPDDLLTLMSRMLMASEQLDSRPDEQLVKNFLSTALTTLSSSS